VGSMMTRMRQIPIVRADRVPLDAASKASSDPR
jgi:hypothetical protein